MKRELKSSKDIQFLVQTFYGKVLKDDVIGYIFNDVMDIDWDKHFPIMYSFWESVLLGKNTYNGNPMIKHIDLNMLEPLKEHHFDRWLLLWEQTLTENFEGAKAEEALVRARGMKQLMLMKIEEFNMHKGV